MKQAGACTSSMYVWGGGRKWEEDAAGGRFDA